MFIKRFIICCCLIAQPVFAQPHHVLDIQHWTTNHGVPVYFVPAPDLPMIDIFVAFDAGSARDEKHPGIAKLTNSLLDQGTNKLSADQIAANFDDVGAQFGSATYRDVALLELRSLTFSDYLLPSLATFEALLSQPSFNQHAFDRERDSQLADIAYKKQRPAALASDTFFATLYQQHPYAHPVVGTPDSLRKMTSHDVESFYRQYYVAKNMLIIMVGAVDLTQAKQIANQLASTRPKGTKAAPLPAAKPSTKQQRHINLPVAQTTLLLGQVAIDRHDPDYFPLIVANYSLGSGVFVSRLYQQVREQRGLSYSIYSHFIPMRAKGPFMVSFATRGAQANQALTLTQTIINDFVKQGPTEQELSDAKQNSIGGFSLKLDSNDAIANALLNYAYFQLPKDYFDTYRDNIEGVTLAEIRQALKNKLNPTSMSLVSVGQVKVAKHANAKRT